MPKKAMEILTESMFYVLMSFLSGEKCGAEIVEDVEALTGGRLKLGPGTLYTILAKFEKKKHIEELDSDGHRRVYRIAKRGLEAYEEELIRLRRCIADAEAAAERSGSCNGE